MIEVYKIEFTLEQVETLNDALYIASRSTRPDNAHFVRVWWRLNEQVYK